MTVYYVYAVSSEARRGSQIPRNWGYSYWWMLRLILGWQEEQLIPAVLNTNINLICKPQQLFWLPPHRSSFTILHY